MNERTNVIGPSRRVGGLCNTTSDWLRRMGGGKGIWKDDEWERMNDEGIGEIEKRRRFRYKKKKERRETIREKKENKNISKTKE